ncbi:MAG TPA: AmmeMemoRadiSam system protein B [Phycisphaerae bacterium]|nr:AmmeMemoRadiSam system protein B [Phycisphaerae bacterium]
MIIHPDLKPRLRPVEPFQGSEPGTLGIRDPSGLSQVAMTLSEPAFFILALFDGTKTLTAIQEKFLARYREPVSFDTLVDLVTRLEESLLLEGPKFDAHYQQLLDQYRSAPVRTMHSAESLGLDEDAGSVFQAMLGDTQPAVGDGCIAGLIAPHLDYPRGRPCYSAAYGSLAQQGPPDRFVILGTNHFGLGGRSSVVGTTKDFDTPLGKTATDRAFLERIEERCGDLRRHEYDHVNEHSIELQLCWLQHLYGADCFEMVAFLCPDPCGPTGTAPFDGKGVDLGDFARMLRRTIDEDDKSTVMIAGADFSHVGRFFGDKRVLGDDFLDEVRQWDKAVLRRIEQGDGAAFRECVANRENPTRICSTGCMFTLMTALPDAKATVLDYHQAVERGVQNCVTCAAVLFRQ